MKQFLLSILAALLSLNMAQAQTATTHYQPGVTAEGAVYSLPKTAISVSVLIEKATYQPGQFSKYAERYLRLTDVAQQPQVSYRVLKVSQSPIAVPDTSKMYAVKFDARTSAARVNLSDDGRLLSINCEPEVEYLMAPFVPAERLAPVDGRQFLNQEILAAGSMAKMAELTANEIYDLRENRNLLIKGQADFMPKDGTQLQLMLDQLDLQDRALTAMFKGTLECDTTEEVLIVVPDTETKRQVLFRMSQKLGMLDADDLGGVPYYLDIEVLKQLPKTDITAQQKRKPVNGIYVNVPGRLRSTIYQGDQKLSSVNYVAPQFGNVELLSGDLFNKRYTTRLWLNPLSGAVEKIEAEQPK